jgi:hypothetical protein
MQLVQVTTSHTAFYELNLLETDDLRSSAEETTSSDSQVQITMAQMLKAVRRMISGVARFHGALGRMARFHPSAGKADSRGAKKES